MANKKFRIMLVVEDYMAELAEQTKLDSDSEIIEPYTVEELKEEFAIRTCIHDILGLEIKSVEIEEVEGE